MNELFLKDLIIPLALTILGGSFAGGAAVAWWGIRRMVTGQDLINQTLTEIRDELGQTNGRVRSMEMWSAQHEKQNDSWQSRSERDRQELWSVLRKHP